MGHSIFAHRSGRHATFFSTLGDMGRAAKRGMDNKNAKKPLGMIPHAKIANSVNKVGSAKLGHGALCHANRIDKMEGSRNGGKGLRRVNN
jgi:hypothetical protein